MKKGKEKEEYTHYKAGVLDPVAEYILKQDLVNQKCFLHHPEQYPPGPAVNYLVIPHDTGAITIPVCQLCLDSLEDPNDGWYLFYCLRCGESVWLHEVDLRKEYPEKIMVLSMCPRCSVDKNTQ